MQKFFAVYVAPVATMEEWMKTDPETRKTEEAKMKADWDVWMESHKEMATSETAALGKTKRVTKDGIADTKNDLMLYTIVEAESHEAAAAIFKDHPHFGIPGASIDVMPVNHLPEMNSGE